MEITALLAIVSFARSTIVTVIEQVEIARAKGEVTPEQVAKIKERAGVADAEWDEVAAAARQRLAAKANPT